MMVQDQTFNSIQAFPLTKGQIHRTSGDVEDVRIIACVTDGIVHLNDFGEEVSLLAGDVLCFDKQSVTINSGEFHLS
jgi:hypothetical protein